MNPTCEMSHLKSILSYLFPDCREVWEGVCELKTEVLREITEMERLLSMRMKSIIAGTEVHYDGRGTADLASLQIINQVL